MSSRSSSGRGRAGDRGRSRRPTRADQLHARAEALQANLEKLTARSKVRADRLERWAARLDALDVWLREEPGQRQARFTRSDLARAAVRIIDTEGLDALSMRRLAAELDAGTMTLYHYVRNKDELLTLVNDEVMGEVLLPDGTELPSDWKEAIVLLAARSRAAMHRHPWVFDIPSDLGFGPNGLRHFDQTLQAVAGLDVPLLTKLDVVIAVDEYVFGHCLQERGGWPSDDQKTEATRYVENLVRDGDYPEIARYLDELGVDGIWRVLEEHAADDTRFERNLRRFLRGIELDLGL